MHLSIFRSVSGDKDTDVKTDNSDNDDDQMSVGNDDKTIHIASYSTDSDIE